MGQNTTNVSISFPVKEAEAIDERARELKLPKRGGRSKYFQMLRELDKKFPLQIYYHASDGGLHFYPEPGHTTFVQREEEARLVAEELSSDLERASKAAPAKKPGEKTSRSPHT